MKPTKPIKHKQNSLKAWGLVSPEVVYKVRHIPSGKWLSRSFHVSVPWRLVTSGGRVFTHPQYINAMITKREITEDWLMRHGLGSFAHYEVVPVVLIEIGDEALNLAEIRG